MATDVLILGAGIAGLHAANLLVDAGMSVAILEARDRTGGRIRTLYGERFGAPLELGAEFIHGRPPQTFQLLKNAGLAACDVPDNHYYVHGRKLKDNAKFWPQIEQVMARLGRDGRSDESFDVFLRRQRDISSSARRHARDFVEGFDAADATQIGIRGLAMAQRKLEKIQGELAFRPVGGYGALINYLTNRLRARKASIHLNVMVRQIKWDPRSCEMVANMGGKTRSFSAAKCLVTLPLGVLKAGEVAFSPDVPGLTETLAAMQMGPVVKIIVRFKKAFWESSELRDLAFVHGSDLAFPTWWTQLPLRLPLLTGWAGGPPAADLALLREKQILDAAISSLARVFSKSRPWIAREIESHWLANWAVDPFSRGAYSYVVAGGLNNALRFHTLGQKAVYFAGEHTDAGLIGTVAASLASAERAVKAIKMVM
ncbi:MAG TPA: NAD(P)/FAD-dependent oxidoreductase [Tepidisphaeraceae bacterium]|nr:NAD(P)/FAD-dependent oxidoreductase [Tepidisphaeraceae bacterium]